ncbi:MAG: hypothetical protein GYB68_09395 [Chloroflexi bacterium]|nr:hypothetical protein [Chloroflexota bacterium]
MANVDRKRWQYCQIETSSSNTSVLRQFFPDRAPVVYELHENWPSMLGKLGDQGWEMVSAFPSESGRSRSPVTYVFKRPLGVAGTQSQSAPADYPASDEPPDPEPPDFEPLRGI